MAEQLKDLIASTQEAFKSNPTSAQATFASSSNLESGLRSDVAIRQHRIVVDEPANLGGTDTGPNPVELILASLGACQEITYRAFATALGIPLDRVSVKLEGDIDLRGFFAVDESVRPGYQKIRGTVHLESSASDAQLSELRDMVNAHCPVLDMVTRPVPVELELETKRKPAAA